MSRPSVQGSVLIAVLWVCLALVTLTLVFGHSMVMTLRGGDNDLAGRQADQAIEGGARYVESLMSNASEPGLMPDLTAYLHEQVPVGEALFWFLGRPESAEGAEYGTEPVFGLVDEASKLNLNVATVEMLEALPGMTQELAAAIVDWRDADDDVTENGAESQTYLLLRPGYAAKNAPFESIEELTLLSGADPIILYGEDTNMNGVLDPNEDDGDASYPPDNSDGKLDPGIMEYVTVFSREPNARSDGSQRIDASQAGDELTSYLRDSLGQARLTEIETRLGPNWQVRSLLELQVRGGMTADELDTISGDLTIGADTVRVGLININTASEKVLECVPGIGLEKAAEVVAARLGRAQSSTGIGWVADVLGPQNAVRAGLYLTGQSWQIRADIAAVGRHGRGYRRTMLVVDAAGGTPQIVYRRNLAPLGWALGPTMRETLKTIAQE